MSHPPHRPQLQIEYPVDPDRYALVPVNNKERSPDLDSNESSEYGRPQIRYETERPRPPPKRLEYNETWHKYRSPTVEPASDGDTPLPDARPISPDSMNSSRSPPQVYQPAQQTVTTTNDQLRELLASMTPSRDQTQQVPPPWVPPIGQPPQHGQWQQQLPLGPSVYQAGAVKSEPMITSPEQQAVNQYAATIMMRDMPHWSMLNSPAEAGKLATDMHIQARIASAIKDHCADQARSAIHGLTSLTHMYRVLSDKFARSIGRQLNTLVTALISIDFEPRETLDMLVSRCETLATQAHAVGLPLSDTASIAALIRAVARAYPALHFNMQTCYTQSEPFRHAQEIGPPATRQRQAARPANHAVHAIGHQNDMPSDPNPTNASEMGDVTHPNAKLNMKDVLHLPRLHANIISARVLQQLGHNLCCGRILDHSGQPIATYDKDFMIDDTINPDTMHQEPTPDLRETPDGGDSPLPGPPAAETDQPIVVAALRHIRKTVITHGRLLHAHHHALAHTVKKMQDAVVDKPIDLHAKNIRCHCCDQSKATLMRPLSERPPTTLPMQTLHTDVANIGWSSRNDNRLFWVLVDEHTRE
ncbi:hypothetical protein BROUX41_003428 [Berkeleyomyces rouxiae]